MFWFSLDALPLNAFQILKYIVYFVISNEKLEAISFTTTMCVSHTLSSDNACAVKRVNNYRLLVYFYQIAKKTICTMRL